MHREVMCARQISDELTDLAKSARSCAKIHRSNETRRIGSEHNLVRCWIIILLQKSMFSSRVTATLHPDQSEKREIVN